MFNSLIASLPLLLHSLSAFQLSSSPHIWGKAENAHAILSISVEQSNTLGESTTRDENDIEQPPWWTSVKLPHAHIAEKVRKDFAILDTTVGGKPLVYLDSAATSQKPRAVLDALQQYYETSNANVHRGAHRLSRDATAAYEGARDDVANFIGASSRNECIFTRGATEAINLVAMTYGRTCMTSPDDEIVLTELEHHSNLVPWQILSDQTHCKLRYAHLDRETGMVDMDEFRSLLSPKTKLVTFQHVSNVMGCANPVAEMVQAVREASPDAKILLDACQSVPHQRFNVQELGVDFVAFSGHKMCGPTGIGVLWGREDLLNSMPPFLGGGEMIDQVTLEGSTFVAAPGRFEAGTPAIAQAIGLGAAIRYLNEIGMENIEAYEHELGNYLYKRLSECQGIHILGPKEGRMGLCAFYSDDVHPSDLSAFLDVEGIAIRAGHHCCQPLHRALGYSHSARASLYFYNTKEEIDKFIEVLDNSISFFRNLSSDGEIKSDHDDFVPFI